jgi:hypothetical protein
MVVLHCAASDVPSTRAGSTRRAGIAGYMRNEGIGCHPRQPVASIRTIERSMAKSERLTRDPERQRFRTSNVLRRNVRMLNKWTSLASILAIQ